jgi:hypothetical protein
MVLLIIVLSVVLYYVFVIYKREQGILDPDNDLTPTTSILNNRNVRNDKLVRRGLKDNIVDDYHQDFVNPTLSQNELMIRKRNALKDPLNVQILLSLGSPNERMTRMRHIVQTNNNINNTTNNNMVNPIIGRQPKQLALLQRQIYQQASTIPPDDIEGNFMIGGVKVPGPGLKTSYSMGPGAALRMDQEVVSRNGIYTFKLQKDGNVPLRENNGAIPIWYNGIQNQQCFLMLQHDSDLAEYVGEVGVSQGRILWHSNTANAEWINNGTYIYGTLLDIGIFVVFGYNKNKGWFVIWSTPDPARQFNPSLVDKATQEVSRVFGSLF